MFDTLDQPAHGAIRAAANDPPRHEAEPTFDLVEPRAVARGEMHVVAGMPREPRPHARMFAGRIVVEDQMEVQAGGHLGVEMPEKREELLIAMAPPVART